MSDGSIDCVDESVLYNRQRSINKKKVADLLELLHYIPPVHNSFYQEIDEAISHSDSESDGSDAD